MTIPLIVFAVLSFFAFFSFNPFGAADGWFYRAIERPQSVVPASVQAADTGIFEEALHHYHAPAMMLSLAVAGLGILAAFATYHWKKISADAWAARLPGLHRFLVNKWYFDELYGALVVDGTLGITRFLRWIDIHIIDGLVNGSASWTVAVVFGYTEHRRGKKFSSLAFLFVSLAVSFAVALWAAQWLWPPVASIGSMIGAVLLAALFGGLTLFFFWSGAGRFDKFVVDGIVNGTAYFSGFFGILLRKTQTGRVQTYIVLVILAVMVFFYVLRSM